MEILLRRPKRQDKKNKNRKYGRNARTAKHRMGQFCGLKGCVNLAESRRYDEKLKIYIIRG